MTNTGNHRMDRRSKHHRYSWAGRYHVTIRVADRLGQPLGRVVGQPGEPEGSPDAPRVELSAVGRMVEHELTAAITARYPMVTVEDYVIMPDHLHAIIAVHSTIVSATGRVTHLGQLIAGFKKGCNRRYWALTAPQQGAPAPQQPAATAAAQGAKEAPPRDKEAAQRGEPAATVSAPDPPRPAAAAAQGGKEAAQGGATTPRPVAIATAGQGGECLAVSPQGPAAFGGRRPPSGGSTGRAPLFAYGYVDVMPVDAAQLAQQRRYIRNNPRSRLLRTQNRAWLMTQRQALPTALFLPALKGYLQRECTAALLDAAWGAVEGRLLTVDGQVVCESYGNRELLCRPLLPVVCHRRDAPLFGLQRERCLSAARQGSVLVSARIAKGEQAIIDEAIMLGLPVVLVVDNGFPERYHPSEARIAQCAGGRLLLVTPWRYQYRGAADGISVVQCKAMNCVVQSLCRKGDTWWKTSP